VAEEILAAELVEDDPAPSPDLGDGGSNGDDDLFGESIGQVLKRLKLEEPGKFWFLAVIAFSVVGLLMGSVFLVATMGPISSISVTAEIVGDTDLEFSVFITDSLLPGNADGELLTVEVLYYDAASKETIVTHSFTETLAVKRLVGDAEGMEFVLPLSEMYAGNGFDDDRDNHYRLRLSAGGEVAEEPIQKLIIKTADMFSVFFPCERGTDTLEFQLQLGLAELNSRAVVTHGNFTFNIFYDTNDGSGTPSWTPVHNGSITVEDREMDSDDWQTSKPSPISYTYTGKLDRSEFYDANGEGPYRLDVTFTHAERFVDSNLDPVITRSVTQGFNFENTEEGVSCFI